MMNRKQGMMKNLSVVSYQINYFILMVCRLIVDVCVVDDDDDDKVNESTGQKRKQIVKYHPMVECWLHQKIH